jgi:hypothetical protein
MQASSFIHVTCDCAALVRDSVINIACTFSILPSSLLHWLCRSPMYASHCACLVHAKYSCLHTCMHGFEHAHEYVELCTNEPNKTQPSMYNCMGNCILICICLCYINVDKYSFISVLIYLPISKVG